MRRVLSHDGRLPTGRPRHPSAAAPRPDPDELFTHLHDEVRWRTGSLFRYDHDPGRGASHDLAPGAGDLVVMGGRCQAGWEHSVPYLRDRLVGPRISLQWRFTSRTGRPHLGGSYRAPRHCGRH